MTQSPDDQLAVVLGQRQLIAVCCMFLVILGLVATMAYVTGRSISAAQMKTIEKSDVPPAIVVDGSKPPQSVPGPLEAKAETLPASAIPVQQMPAAVVPQMAAPTPIESGEPAPGQTFWQVGLVDRGMAPVFVEYLMRQGFRARLAPGQSAGGMRVLVGPLTGQADTEKTKRGLDALSIQAFLKRF